MVLGCMILNLCFCHSTFIHANGKRRLKSVVATENFNPRTCDDVEALLPLGEGDVVGDEGGVGVRLHAGVSGLEELQTPAAVGPLLQELGPDEGHRRRDGRHGEADHRVQLGHHVAQSLQRVHVAWPGFGETQVEKDKVERVRQNVLFGR